MPRKRNSNGGGSIRQRPDGRWEARYSAGRDPGTGKPLRFSVYGDTEAEVRKALTQATAAVDTGTFVEPSRITVGQWLAVWHAEYVGNVKPATAAKYEQDIELYIKPAIGSVLLQKLQPPAIQKMHNDLKKTGRKISKEEKPRVEESKAGKEKKAPAAKPLSPKTIRNVHGCLHRALQQAVLLGYIRVNPSEICTLPRVEKAEIHPLDNAEISTFLKAISEHPLEALYKVAVFTGMREGELLGLTWDRVDFKRGTIRIDRQLLRPRKKGDEFKFGPLKNDKPRTITPVPFVMDTLKEHRKAQLAQKLSVGPLWVDGPGYVFTNETGAHASYWSLITRLKTILKNAGIQPRRFHDLRHSYAVAALRAGDSIKSVQDALGHHTAAFTMDTYAHVTEEMRKESAARMEAFISGLNK